FSYCLESQSPPTFLAFSSCRSLAVEPSRPAASAPARSQLLLRRIVRDHSLEQRLALHCCCRLPARSLSLQLSASASRCLSLPSHSSRRCARSCRSPADGWNRLNAFLQFRWPRAPQQRSGSCTVRLATRLCSSAFSLPPP